MNRNAVLNRLLAKLFMLPYDAWGLGREADELAHRVRVLINRQRWSRFPAWIRPAAMLGARALWLAWCPVQATILARRHGGKVAGRVWWRAVYRGILYGHKAIEEFAPARALALVCHQDVGHLRDNHWQMLWPVLGNEGSRALAQDKLDFAKALRSRGLPVPDVLQELPRGRAVVLADLPWSKSEGLFIKPRRGAKAIGAMSLRPLPGGSYLINGSQVMGSDELGAALTRLAARDSLLVQPFLKKMALMDDLSCESPLELRITTATDPQGDAFVAACYLKIQPPGNHAATILTGAMSVPADPETGILDQGFLLSDPEMAYPRLPWNGASLAGRPLPHYDDIRRMVIAASGALPGVPVIGWDVLLTAGGPVILEANTGLSWRLMHLRHAAAAFPSPLRKMIRAWMDMPGVRGAPGNEDGRLC